MFYEMDDSHYSSKSILSKRIYRTYGGSGAKLLMFSFVDKKHMTVKIQEKLQSGMSKDGARNRHNLGYLTCGLLF